jgi:dolichol-phosphate mannosyltransferase
VKKFSIVVPVYYNELNLPETVPILLGLGDSLPDYALELVFVDDGSGDRSLSVLQDFQCRYPDRIALVTLTRNFGSMAAVQAGLTVATGDCVGIIAADLQDPPELFLEMVSHWERGVKAVFAVRVDREESFFQKLFAKTYYTCLRKFAIPGYPAGGFDFLLIDRQIVGEVNRIQEKNTNIMSLIFWLGHGHVMLPYTRRRRDKGKSRWTLSKKIKLFVDSFVAFSYLPIRLLSGIGLFVAASAFVYGGFIFYSWTVSRIEIKGWTTIMILLTFASGMQMTMLGVLGEYLWRVLDETKKRPSFVIDQIMQEGDGK